MPQVYSGQSSIAIHQIVVSLGGYGPVTLGTSNDATDASKSLGFFEVDVEGLTRLRATLRYRRVGTGVLTIELFNETTGNAIMTQTDNSTTTDQSITQIIFPSNGIGVHRLRLRIRSTVGTDVPIFYGASFILS